MKACVLRSPAPVESNPLEWTEVPTPEPNRDQLLIHVHACGVCRTDLHVVEGELPPRRSPVIPGHQVVGVVERAGRDAHRFKRGDRVGVAWLHRTDGVCEYCLSDRENLCDAPEFTGYTVDGGYAEYVVAPDAFVYGIPKDSRIWPRRRCCARALSGSAVCVWPASRKARGWGCGDLGRRHMSQFRWHAIGAPRYTHSAASLATRNWHPELGAVWSGGSFDEPPKKLDAAIIFAPAGELVPASLKALKKGGAVVLGGIHMSPIPEFEYRLLYGERIVRSVANNTRQDGEDFLKIAAAIPIHTRTQLFPMQDANAALNAVKHDQISGAAVLENRQAERF